MLWDKSLVPYTDHTTGKPVPSTIVFYYQGTTDEAVVYKDPDYTAIHASPIRTDYAGRIPEVHLKPEGRKLRADITTANWKTKSLSGIDPQDHETADAATTAPMLPAATKSGIAVSITDADFGTFVGVPTASGNVVPVQLPSPTSIPNGSLLGIQNAGDGLIPVRTIGSALIDEGKAVLLGPRQSLVVRATGGTYETFGKTSPPKAKFVVKNRTTTTPPTSGVTAGDAYLAPTGATGGWSPDSIYEANGGGGWIRTTPEIGDTCAVIAETVSATSDTATITRPMILTWSGTKWVDDAAFASLVAENLVDAALTPLTARVTAVEAKIATGEQQYRVTSQVASGVSSLVAQGSVQPVADSWTRILLTTTTGGITLTDGSASTANNLVSLPKGKYRIRATRKAKGQIDAVVGWRSTSTATFLRGMPRRADTSINIVCELDDVFEVTGTSEQFELLVLLHGTVGALSLGDASAITGLEEVYAEAVIETRAA